MIEVNIESYRILKDLSQHDECYDARSAIMEKIFYLDIMYQDIMPTWHLSYRRYRHHKYC